MKNLPKTEIRKKFSDVIFEAVCNAPIREDYKYNEPSDLEEIKALRKEHIFDRKTPDTDTLKSKISGAWMGRVCGCLLGKPVEGIRTNEFFPMLKEMGNYPLTKYMKASDITEEMYGKYNFNLRNKCFADTVHGMPVDDDTNYVVLAHLSHENNTETIALNTLKNTLNEYNVKFNNIYIAKQNEKTECFKI